MYNFILFNLWKDKISEKNVPSAVCCAHCDDAIAKDDAFRICHFHALKEQQKRQQQSQQMVLMYLKVNMEIFFRLEKMKLHY